MLKAVIFDLDGTITDSLPIAIEIATEVLKEKKMEIKDVDFYRSIKIHSRQELKEKLGLSMHQAIRLIFKARKRLIKRYDEVDLHPDMNKVIKKISKNYNIGVLTTNYKKAVEIQQKKHGLEDNFDVIIAGSFWKAKMLKKLMKKLKVTKDEVIYIGDEVKDIISCKQVGIPIISVTWGYNTKEALKSENPDFMVDKPEEILKVLNEIK